MTTGAVADMPRERRREPREPPQRDWIGHLITAGIVACSVVAGVWGLQAHIDDGLARHDRQIARLEAVTENLTARFDQFERERDIDQKAESVRLDQIGSGVASLTTGLADLKRELRK